MGSTSLLIVFCLLFSFCSKASENKNENKFITKEILPTSVTDCLELLENSLVEHQFSSYLVTKDTTAKGIKDSKRMWIDSWITLRVVRKKCELGPYHLSLTIRNLGQIINKFHYQCFGWWEDTIFLSDSSYDLLLKKKENYADLKKAYSSKLPIFEKFSTTRLISAQASGWIASVIRVQLVLLDLILAQFQENDYDQKWEMTIDQIGAYNFTLDSINPVAKLLLSCGPDDATLNEIFNELRQSIDIVVMNLHKDLRISHPDFPDWAVITNVPIFLASCSDIFEGVSEFEMIILARRRAIMALGRLYRRKTNLLTKESIEKVTFEFRPSSTDISLHFGLFYCNYFTHCFKTPQKRINRILHTLKYSLGRIKARSNNSKDYMTAFINLCYIEEVLERLEIEQLSVRDTEIQIYMFLEDQLRTTISLLESFLIKKADNSISFSSENFFGLSIISASQSVAQFKRFAEGKEELGDLLIDLYDVLVWLQDTIMSFKKNECKLKIDLDLQSYRSEFIVYADFVVKNSSPLDDIESGSSNIFEIHSGTWPEKAPESFKEFFLHNYSSIKLVDFSKIRKMIAAQQDPENIVVAEKKNARNNEIKGPKSKVGPPSANGRNNRKRKAKKARSPAPTSEIAAPPISPTSISSINVIGTGSVGFETANAPLASVSFAGQNFIQNAESENSGAPLIATTSIHEGDAENESNNTAPTVVPLVGCEISNVESDISTLTRGAITVAQNNESENGHITLVTTTSLKMGEPAKNFNVKVGNMTATVSLNSADEKVKLDIFISSDSEHEALAKEVSNEESEETEAAVNSSEGTASEGKEEEQEVEHDQDEGEETDSTTTSDPDTSQLFHILTCIDYDDLENAGDAVDPRDIAMAYILIGEKIYKDYLKEFITLTKCKPTLYKSQDAFEACIRTHYIMQNAEFKAAMERTGIPNMAYLWKSIRFYRKRNQFVNQATPMFKRFRAKIIRMNLEILNVYAKEQTDGDIYLPAIDLSPILAGYKERLANTLNFTGSTCYPIQKDGRPDTFLTPELTEITLAVLSLHRFVTYGKTKSQSKSLLPQTVFESRHRLAHPDIGSDVLGSYIAHIFGKSSDFDFLTWLINVNSNQP